MARAAVSPADRPVTRGDIEAKLREIRGEVDATAEGAKSYLLAAGVAAAVVLVGAAFLLGRRRGRKKTTVVEIRRV
jgi:hypothetical protein